MEKKNIIRKCFVTAAVLLSSVAHAQGFLDEPRDNQFLVGETGTTHLTPGWYYNALHKSYQSDAARKNKLALRGLFKLELLKQEPTAEEIDSALVFRGKVAALEMADRLVDLAWMTEGSKLNRKLGEFKKKIDMIVPSGGNVKVKEEYETQYKSILSGIQAIQDGYHPNSMRKREYAALYRDLLIKDSDLDLYLYDRTILKEPEKFKVDSVPHKFRPSFGASARAAHTRWKNAISRASK